MSANEVIEQIRQLPTEDRLKVFAFVHQVEAQIKKTQPEAGRADDVKFQQAVDWVFTEHRELMRRLSQ
ncbi:MAG: hypothetical protein HY043_10760 [Verrucomicrobia bacterium]|nr:hypothetical protein [Verrucomicrobiota bacterium]